MKNQLGLFVSADPSKCTGCKACEVACFVGHNEKRNQLGKTVGTVEIPVTPKLYVTISDNVRMPMQCKHCEDAPCRQVCQKSAISLIDGQVIVDEAKCIGCKDCLMACPYGCISLMPLCINGKNVLQADGEPKVAASKCDLCFEDPEGPLCVRVCPNEALRTVDVEEERKAKNISAAEALLLINA